MEDRLHGKDQQQGDQVGKSCLVLAADARIKVKVGSCICVDAHILAEKARRGM